MTKIHKFFTTIVLAIIMSSFALMPTNVSVVQEADAQSLLCDIFPFLENISAVSDLCTGDAETASTNAISSAATWVRFALSLIFVGIIAIAIFGIIKAAITYIRAEGDEGKVEEATKSIKNVFIGIGALLVGIIGLVILLSFFGAGGALNRDDANTPPEIQEILDAE